MILGDWVIGVKGYLVIGQKSLEGMFENSPDFQVEERKE